MWALHIHSKFNMSLTTLHNAPSTAVWPPSATGKCSFMSLGPALAPVSPLLPPSSGPHSSGLAHQNSSCPDTRSFLASCRKVLERMPLLWVRDSEGAGERQGQGHQFALGRRNNTNPREDLDFRPRWFGEMHWHLLERRLRGRTPPVPGCPCGMSLGHPNAMDSQQHPSH